MVKSKNKKLVVFVDRDCEICAETMAYLKSKKINFEEIDLDSHPSLQGFPYAPVICQIKEKGKSKCQIGFNREGIDKLLKEKKKGKK